VPIGALPAPTESRGDMLGREPGGRVRDGRGEAVGLPVGAGTEVVEGGRLRAEVLSTPEEVERCKPAAPAALAMAGEPGGPCGGAPPTGATPPTPDPDKLSKQADKTMFPEPPCLRNSSDNVAT